MTPAAIPLLFLALQQHPSAPPAPSASTTKSADAPVDDVDNKELVLPNSGDLEVKLVSAAGEPDLLDVVAHDAPAHAILARVAQATGRRFWLDPGEAALRAQQGVDVQLVRRPLREVVTCVAGAAGLDPVLTRNEIRCAADLPGHASPEELLKHAVEQYRLALLHDPLQPDAPRLRFEIGNALYELGDFAQASLAYDELEKVAPEYGDLPWACFRSGRAHALLGDEEGAIAQWSTLTNNWPHHALAAAARLEIVRSFRRKNDEPHARDELRLVVEGMRGELSPQDLVTAGELLAEGGEGARAIEALHWALQSTSDPQLEERALDELARAHASLSDWPGVIVTVERYLHKHSDGAHAADLYELMARAHRALHDPFTALLALKRMRELKPDDATLARCDLLEAQVLADAGMDERAERLLARAAASDKAEIAAPALELSAELLRAAGQFEAASQRYERLAVLPGKKVAAAVGLAEVTLLQHDRKRCLELVANTLPQANESERARLQKVAIEALEDAEDAGPLLQAAPTTDGGSTTDEKPKDETPKEKSDGP